MNQKTLESKVTFYKTNYKKIEKNELYKWKAVKTFQDNWNMDADNFYTMLNILLHDISNLMSAGNYYPRRMILWMAEKDSEAVREMFRELSKSGDFENLFKFESLCKYIHNYIMHDAELPEMYEPRKVL